MLVASVGASRKPSHGFEEDGGVDQDDEDQYEDDDGDNSTTPPENADTFTLSPYTHRLLRRDVATYSTCASSPAPIQLSTPRRFTTNNTHAYTHQHTRTCIYVDNIVRTRTHFIQQAANQQRPFNQNR